MKIISPLLLKALRRAKKYEKEVTLQGLLYSIYEICEETDCSIDLPNIFKKKRRKRKTEGKIPDDLLTYIEQTTTGPVIDVVHVISSIQDEASEEEVVVKRKRNPILEIACKNLVSAAGAGRLDPIIGRDKELSRLIKCLGRRKKNNAIIIGQAGVGKTGLVEKLAQYINDGNVPDHLIDMPIYELSVMKLATMRAEKAQLLLDQLENAEVILFIDEIHLLMDHRFKDMAQILKPLLTKGTFRAIGATTREEYIRNIVPDDAFRRRFEMIDMEENTHEETVKILFGLRHLYESFHNLEINDQVIKNIVSFSGRYLPGNMPDKAIDLLESICSYVVAGNATRKIVLEGNDFLGYHQARKKQNERTSTVTEDHVREVIEMVSGISNACDITYEDLLEKMRKEIVGLDSQIEEIASHIAKSHNIYRNRGCLASMLFTGPDGSGKEHTARTLCKILFGSDKPFLIVDMDYYSSHYNISRLIGAPPGYLGYEHGGGLLSKFVSDHPSGIIFLDKMESDDSTATTLFRRAVEDGKIEAASGLTIDMRNYIIIGSYKGIERNKSMGFQKDSEETTAMPDVSFLRPIIRMRSLTQTEFPSVIEMKIKKIVNRLEEKGVNVQVKGDVIDFIAKKAPDTAGIDILINSYILDQITYKDNDILFQVEGDKIVKENNTDGGLSDTRKNHNTKTCIQQR